MYKDDERIMFVRTFEPAKKWSDVSQDFFDVSDVLENFDEVILRWGRSLNIYQLSEVSGSQVRLEQSMRVVESKSRVAKSGRPAGCMED